MNVILIETDQLSAKWLGCYGNPAAHTPNLDLLASRSMQYNNCFANNPVCMPSRASTMTGRSCQHHGVYYNGWELGAENPTFPGLLQQRGFQSFGIGKFHHECHARGAFLDVKKYGFDRAETTEDIRAGDWLEWVRKEHPECYDAALSTCWPMPCLHKYGPDDVDLETKIKAVREATGYYADAAGIAYKSIVPEKACQTTWITERAMTYVSERDESRPFFLKVSYVDPHDHYDPPQRFIDMINPDLIPSPLPGDDLSIPFMDIPFVVSTNFTKEEWKQVRWHYFASIAFIDEQVGRLLKFIKNSKLEKNTAIIFTSDHGDMMGDHCLPTKGAWHYDACIRVPLIIHIPDRGAGIENQSVTNLDIFPTIMSLAGIKCDVPVEGRNLTVDEWKKRPDAALIESFGSYGELSPEKRARTVANGKYRYTRFGDGSEILFDLHSDPDECHNSINCSASQSVITELRETMLELISAQYTPLPERNMFAPGQH